ncbi:glycosyl transferase family 90 [Jiella mangrovi]|uniref:Glycosyl transferase CAP10 domain-containing protein n=1 Tax=Jiella mangrovi TaxID=2821407 RepID=A0ABS4BCD6_9HYPH|nr:glycosyl transferase family 90 [Jiella mangrovi]MBP0614399.1 hypothetical protein [Jiella mangrovi]
MNRPKDRALDTIAEWADRELAFWLHCMAGPRDFSAEHARLNETRRSIFLFDIAAGHAAMRPKPDFFTAEEIEARGCIDTRRAGLYRDFLADCVKGAAMPAKPATIAIDVSDFPLMSRQAPIFCFHKPRGAANPLVPDVHFFTHDWYAGDRDTTRFAQKRSAAVFAGASTGGSVTADVLRNAALPRLRLAQELHGHPDIDFRITAAVQCESPAVREALEAQPYFGSHLSWAEQYGHRFIISVDGNAAAWSRVVRVLMSGSVLMKFPSDSVLYYYHGLAPNRHFLPAQSREDIEAFIALDRAGALDLPAIAKRANGFARDYLARDRVVAYAQAIFGAYARWQTGEPAPTRSRWRSFLPGTKA